MTSACTQEKVLNAFEDLVEVLHSADEDEGHECNLLWRSLHHRGQSAEPYEEAGIKFHAMQLFCAIVSMDMRLHVFLRKGIAPSLIHECLL